MKLYENISLNQVRKDLMYLRNTYGNLQDFCGSFCNTGILNRILMGKLSVKEAAIENILCYFSNGIECVHARFSDVFPDKNDKRIQKIIDRYCIETYH